MNTLPNRSSTPLTEAEFDELDRLLEQAEPDEAMLIDQLDGFCVAVASSPQAIPDEEFLAEAIGIAQPIQSPEVPARLVELLRRHRYSVARRLAQGEEFSAVLGQDETGTAVAEPWAAGYLRGLNLYPDAWSAVDGDEVCEEALDLILRFACESNPEAGEVEAIPEDERDELVDMMVDGALEIHARLAPAREQGLKPQTVRHDSPRPGRNDPCPCGSGKKYKQCHGAQ